MRIDQSKFLTLTATLAAGCAPKTPPPTAQPATVVTSAAVVQVASPPAEPVFPDEVAARGSEPANEEALDERPSEQQFPEGEGESPKPVSGAALGCSGLHPPPGPHCESFSSLREDCETIVGALEPGAARRTMACLNGKSGTRAICDFMVLPKCAEQSLARVPLDPGTARPCRKIVRHCSGGLRQHQCQAFLSALRQPQDQGGFVTCLSESCSVAPCFFELP